MQVAWVGLKLSFVNCFCKQGSEWVLAKKSEECAMQRSAGACTQIVKGTPKGMVSCRGGGYESPHPEILGFEGC